MKISKAKTNIQKTKKTKTKGTKLEYSFKSDILFKMLFLRNRHLLKRLIAVLLEIPLNSINHFEITNTEMPPEEIKTKFCRLDINMIVDDRRINLEIQVEDEGNFIERSIFHFARIYSSAINAGVDYADLPKTIIISIIDFELFKDSKDIHSEFYFYETKRHTRLTDKCALHFLELPKMPDVDEIDYENEKDLWLAAFNATTEEELNELTKKGGDFMGELVGAYREIAGDEEFRNLAWMRQKARLDEANALSTAEKRGIATGMEEMIIAAIKNNADPTLIEALRNSADITEMRLAELRVQAQML